MPAVKRARTLLPMNPSIPSLTSIPGAVKRRGPDACIIAWDRVDEALAKLELTAEQQEAAYETLAREWLVILAESYGGEYKIYESDHFLLLTPRGAKLAKNLVQLGERTYDTMTTQLPKIAKKSGFGKFVCIVADTIDRYYGYLIALYPSDDQPASSGVFLSGGYAHFVLNHNEPYSQEHTFVHELTHALVQEAYLPLWLEEGVTQLMESAVLGREFHFERDEIERHLRYWRSNDLADYWSGKSFRARDEGFELSYELSQVFTRTMMSESREKFLQFLERASFLDHGDEASRTIWGRSLGEWAQPFLGPDSRGVELKTGDEFAGRGLLALSHDDLEAARRDFDRATELGIEDPWSQNRVAWIFATAPFESLRNGAAAITLALRCCEQSEWKLDESIDTLAAAYAEAGDFEKATHYQKLALERGDSSFEAEYRAKISQYERGEPYRESLEGASDPEL